MGVPSLINRRAATGVGIMATEVPKFFNLDLVDVYWRRGTAYSKPLTIIFAIIIAMTGIDIPT